MVFLNGELFVWDKNKKYQRMRSQYFAMKDLKSANSSEMHYSEK